MGMCAQVVNAATLPIRSSCCKKAVFATSVSNSIPILYCYTPLLSLQEFCIYDFETPLSVKVDMHKLRFINDVRAVQLLEHVHALLEHVHALHACMRCAVA